VDVVSAAVEEAAREAEDEAEETLAAAPTTRGTRH